MDDVGRLSMLGIFILFGFIFSAMKIALVNVNIVKLEEEVFTDEQVKKFRDIIEKPIEMQITHFNICYIICTAFAVVDCRALSMKAMSFLLYDWALYHNYYVGFALNALALVIVTAFIVSLVVVLPRKLFCRNTEIFVANMYLFVRSMSYVLYPVLWIVKMFTFVFSKIFRIKDDDGSDNITEEQIRYLIDASEENGDIEQEERDMINNIFDFDDKSVSDLMTHRTSIVGLEINEKISDAVYYAINEGFSRIPVYENDIDNIKGIIYVKDLLCLVGCQSTQDFKLSDFIRDVIYVPEAKKCIDLFDIFKAKKAHMAVVVDDYGGTAGIVTMENLLEAIVGNIQDEYDDEQEPIVKVDDTTYILDGALPIEEVEKLFDIDIEYDDETDTIGGFIVNAVGHIPSEAETPSIMIKNILFTAILIEDRRISQIKCEIKVESENETLV